VINRDVFSMILSQNLKLQNTVVLLKGEANQSLCDEIKSKDYVYFFFDFIDIIHSEFVPSALIVYAVFYQNVLGRLLNKYTARASKFVPHK